MSVEHPVPDTLAPQGTSTKSHARLRSALGWLLIAALVIGCLLLLTRLSVSPPSAQGALDPAGADEAGTLALAELLRDQGVAITVARTRAEAAAALRTDSTLVMANPVSLSDEAIDRLIEPADRVVFLSASARLLRLLDIGQDAPAFGEEPVTAECEIAEFTAVGSIRPDRLFEPAAGVTACYPTAEGGAAVLVDERDGTRTSIIQGAALFGNAHLAEDGNAALGLALLGQTPHLVWYVPSYADTDIEAQSPDTLASLTPSWLTPAILLLIVAGVVATISRGQRFGPLVAETLPVTVRASETMHGRARLTAKAADAAHAADAIRNGALRRLAVRLGLDARAAATEIADAAADRLRIQRGSLHELLAGPLPQTDIELIDAARRLAELEAAVDSAVHVERNTP